MAKGCFTVPDGMRSAGRGVAAQKTYLCIDLKSFYASVECADRGLDPLTTNLVVADPERSKNTICLAVTPALKAAGVRNRCRVRDIPPGIRYITAVPRMRRYMEVSSQIVGLYRNNVSPDSLYPYSIDECFIDATPYLRLYGLDAKAFACRLMDEVLRETGITATAGIGTNMFLAKVALDVAAKHAPDGIGVLDEASFKQDIWFHQPITDIWGIGPGIARRLAKYGAFDLAGVAALRPATLRREFGKNAEVLMDHAWGLESCTIEQARSYVPKAHSTTNGQVLMRDYSFDEARTVLREMVYASVMELVEKRLACDSVGLYIGYSSSGLRRPRASAQRFDGGHGVRYLGAPRLHAGGMRSLGRVTDSEHAVAEALLALYDESVDRAAKIRRVNITLGGVVSRDFITRTLFDDDAVERRESELAQAMAAVHERFGANAVLRAISLKEEANARERNNQIGGHRA